MAFRLTPNVGTEILFPLEYNTLFPASVVDVYISAWHWFSTIGVSPSTYSASLASHNAKYTLPSSQSYTTLHINSYTTHIQTQNDINIWATCSNFYLISCSSTVNISKHVINISIKYRIIDFVLEYSVFRKPSAGSDKSKVDCLAKWLKIPWS